MEGHALARAVILAKFTSILRQYNGPMSSQPCAHWLRLELQVVLRLVNFDLVRLRGIKDVVLERPSWSIAYLGDKPATIDAVVELGNIP